MTAPMGFELCRLDNAHYAEILALWQEAGLHIRPEGRDGPTAFARQAAADYHHVVGMRIAAAPGSGSGPNAGSPLSGTATDAPPEVRPAGGAGKLVAVAVLTHDGRKGWINRLAVHPAYRRRGLAQALLAEAERWFTVDCGLEVWAALIERGNLASRGLFDSLGYQPHDVVYVSKRTRPDA